MRGDLLAMSYEDTVEWGRRALSALEGEKPTSQSFRHALKAIDAPFVTPDAVKIRFGKSVREWMNDVMGRNLSAAPAPAAPTVELGPGVTANAQPRTSPDDLLALAIERHERHKRETMGEQDREVTITVDRADQPVMLVGLGDMHLGHPSVDPRDVLARAALAERNDIRVYFLSVGDILEAPFKPKHLVDAMDTAVNSAEEIALAALVLDRFAKPGKLLAVGAGNHDLFAHKQTGYAHLDAAMSRLSRDVPYARIVMFLKVTIRTKDGRHEQSYVHEIRHKARGGGKDPAGAARLHMERSAEDVDCSWFGHTHRSGAAEKNLQGKYRLAIQLGTYKQHRLDGYGTEHDYPDENFDSDRGVLMWANRHKIEETRTDAGVQRLEHFEHLAQVNRRKGAAHGSRRSASTPRHVRAKAVAHPRRLRTKRRSRAGRA